ncbi:hypothetical protein EC523_00730 [Avibacterium paragallinarum]|nr:hypothetical protein EC523_00730 [Avibacterium paragallinarum]
MPIYRVHSSAYHDGSTKGFRHDIKHKRHDCFRGDVRIFQIIDGYPHQISRKRKRFTNKEEAYQWAKQFAQTITKQLKRKQKCTTSSNTQYKPYSFLLPLSPC